MEQHGTKIVIKNNKPECVLIPPSQHNNLRDMLADHIMHTDAQLRMENNHPEENMTHDDMMKELGITREELDAVDVDIE